MNLAAALKKLGKKIFLHGIFWLGVLLFFSLFFGLDGVGFTTVMAYSACLLPVTMATTYTFTLRLIPTYLITKSYYKFALYTFYTIVISATFIMLSVFYGLVLVVGLTWQENLPISKSLIYIIICIYLVVAVASAFHLLKHNYSTSAKNEELRNRILEAQLQLKEQELQYLKMQIHPHFLFNTLNTLYGMSLSRHAATSEMILQLSDLLDYILYQTRKPLVSLKDEINHIKNYIELEKKRFRDRLEIDFNITNVDDSIKIAPMLLLPFVENSFKHGASEKETLKIKISVLMEEDQMCFSIQNSKDDQAEKPEIKKGIGLQNIKKRLEILYPHSHSLKIDETEKSFDVFLKINTSKTPVDAREN